MRISDWEFRRMLFRSRRRCPSTILSDGPPPHRFATGRIGNVRFLPRDGLVLLRRAQSPANPRAASQLASSAKYSGESGRSVPSCLGSSEVLRSEEHTSELQSLMRISYAVFCLNKKKTNKKHHSAKQT